MQHKHAEVIHQWAEGYKVQKLVTLCCDRKHARWLDCDSTPMWFEDEEYRVKPHEEDYEAQDSRL